MNTKPIIFSGPMVRAILDGRKTQTRRIFKVRGPMGVSYPVTCPEESLIELYDNELRDDGTINYLSTGALSGPYECPYGKPGDLLWVRESWQALSFGDYLPTKDHVSDVRYMATDKLADLDKDTRGWPWRPSIHMPRWASRITLEITDVRVQRLQDISQKDADSEGVWETDFYQDAVEHASAVGCGTGFIPKQAFEHLWSSINGPDSWVSNPWVWAVTFNPYLVNVDSLIEGMTK